MWKEDNWPFIGSLRILIVTFLPLGSLPEMVTGITFQNPTALYPLN